MIKVNWFVYKTENGRNREIFRNSFLEKMPTDFKKF